MADLCPHCGRVAQKASPNCLYCGKPLDGSRPARETGEARPLETAPREVAARVRLRPREAEPSGLLSSPWIWTGLVAVAVVLGAVFAFGVGEEEEGPSAAAAELPGPAAAAPPTETEESAVPEAETGPGPDSGDAPAVAAGPQMRERLVDRASDALQTVAGWIEAYAREYGSYPDGIGLDLGALVGVAGGRARLDSIRELFEEGRLDYERTVTASGEQESFVLEGRVRGAGGVEVSVRRSRSRGGEPLAARPAS